MTPVKNEKILKDKNDEFEGDFTKGLL